MYCLISSITHNNCPKFKVYLVSKTCLLISFKFYFKLFFVITYYKIIGSWFTSPIWLFSTSWVAILLSCNLTQLLYGGFSLVIASCFSIPSHHGCLMVLINEFRKCCSHYQSSNPLTITGSFSFNTYCSGCWLWIIIPTTTSTSTLSNLGDLGVL
jgi:hypothetical protein